MREIMRMPGSFIVGQSWHDQLRRTKIMVREGSRQLGGGGGGGTVCRILSLYNLTPLPAKLRETDGEGNNGARDTKFKVFNGTYLS